MAECDLALRTDDCPETESWFDIPWVTENTQGDFHSEGIWPVPSWCAEDVHGDDGLSDYIVADEEHSHLQECHDNESDIIPRERYHASIFDFPDLWMYYVGVRDDIRLDETTDAATYYIRTDLITKPRPCKYWLRQAVALFS